MKAPEVPAEILYWLERLESAAHEDGRAGGRGAGHKQRVAIAERKLARGRLLAEIARLVETARALTRERVRNADRERE